MNGRIVITLMDGKAGIASDFDQANTLLVLEKVKAAIVSDPGPAAVRPATAAEAELADVLARRRNGQG